MSHVQKKILQAFYKFTINLCPKLLPAINFLADNLYSRVTWIQVLSAE